METTTLKEQQAELLDKLYNDLDIDISYDMENNKPENIDDLMEMLDERANEIEVIYYSNAMDYLRDNDASLQESLGLAYDYGYTADKINSELLATLLKQDNAREHLGEYRDRLQELFYPEQD
jgi:alkyl hydroperoxide reductase subunit AhpF